MTRIVVAFALGCIALAFLPVLPEERYALGIPPLLMVGVLRQGRVVAAMVAGFGWSWMAATAVLADRDLAALGSDSELVGRVTGLPRVGGGHVRFDFQVDQLATQIASPIRVRLTWFAPSVKPRSGERWRLRVQLEPVRGLLNPGGSDARLRALVSGIGAAGTIQSGERLADVATLGGWRDQQREQMAAAFAARLSPRPSGAALVAALGLGDRRALSAPMNDALRSTGTGHLLAVSGLHVALAAGVGLFFARFFTVLIPGLIAVAPRPKWEALGALLIATVYAWLTGFELPARRALTMIAALLLSRLSDRQITSVDRLSFAVGVLLVLDPLAVLNGGFWLSCGAVACLLFFSATHGQTGWRDLPKMQVILIVSLWPLGATLFGQVSLIAPIANLLAVSWVGLTIMPIVVTGTFMSLVNEIWGGTLLVAAALQLEWLSMLIEWLATWALADLDLAKPPLTLAVVTTCCLMTAQLWGGYRAWLPAALLVITLFMQKSPPPDPGDLEVQVFDIGPGSAVLIRTHRRNLLFDLGRDSRHTQGSLQSVVLPALREIGVTHLDGAVVSQSSRFHGNALSQFPEGLRPPRLWMATPNRRLGATRCQAGQSWSWDDVSFRFVHPRRQLPDLGPDSGCILVIKTDLRTLLFAGDVSRAVMQRSTRSLGKLDLILAPNHGRLDPSGWMAQGGIVLVSQAHRRGTAPAPFACESLAGCAVYRTNQVGAVQVGLESELNSMTASGWRESNPRWWR